MPGKRAFTLIEILVVIALITILAEILFPVFAQARDKARQATCLSNLKQVGAGIMLYAQDYDEQYPYNYHYSADGRMLWWFQDDIRPYVKNEPVYWCPSFASHTRWTIKRPLGLPNPLIKDYNGNVAAFGFKWPGRPATIPGPTPPMTVNQGQGPSGMTSTGTGSLTSVEDVAGTILAFEGGTSGYQFEIWDLRQTHCAELPRQDWLDTVAELKIGTRHASGFIAIFCDGHAKWLPGPDKVKCGMWSTEAGD